MLRLLIGAPATAQRNIEDLVPGAPEFTVVSRVVDGEELLATIRQVRPDTLILHEGLAGVEPLRVAIEIARERPVSTLLVTESGEVGIDTVTAARLRIVAVTKDLVADPDESQRRLFRTQLRLVSARARQKRSTITRTKLAAVIDDLIEPTEEGAPDTQRRALVTDPLDVIVVAAGALGLSQVVEALEGCTELPVPLVLALDDVHYTARLFDVARRVSIPARAVGTRESLASLDGLVIVSGDNDARFRGEQLEIRPGTTSANLLVASLITCGGKAMAIRVAGSGADPGKVWPRVTAAGVKTAWLRSKFLPDGASPGPALSVKDLTWVLGNTKPTARD